MEGVVKDVEFRKITRKADGQVFDVYDIVLQDDVKWTCWDRDVAERAYNAKGVPATFKVEISQKGEHTNRTFKGIDVKPTATGFGPTLETLSNQVAKSFTQATAQPVQQTATEKDVSIWRQCATKVAATLAATPDEFWGNVEQLVAYYETGIIPRSGQLPQGDPGPSTHVPDGGPEDPSLSPAYVQADDDIPF